MLVPTDLLSAIMIVRARPRLVQQLAVMAILHQTEPTLTAVRKLPVAMTLTQVQVAIEERQIRVQIHLKMIVARAAVTLVHKVRVVAIVIPRLPWLTRMQRPLLHLVTVAQVLAVPTQLGCQTILPLTSVVRAVIRLSMLPALSSQTG